MDPIADRVLHLVASGDHDAAATTALKAVGPDVLRYLRTLTADEDEAADAFSCFAEKLWKGVSTFRSDASLRTWAFRVAWSAAMDVRDQAWRRRAQRFETGQATALADEIRTKTVVKTERQRRALDELCEGLSVEERALLSLRIDQELSWAEIAQVLSAEGRAVQPDALMKRFERLKSRLGEMAREQGLLG